MVGKSWLQSNAYFQWTPDNTPFILISSLSVLTFLLFAHVHMYIDLTILCMFITKTYLYNFDPLKPHFYIVKLGFTGVYIIFVISAQKHRLWVLVRTASTRRF